MSEQGASLELNIEDRVSGREIFEQPSISGLNRLPVVSLLPKIIGRTQTEGELPWTLDDLAERLLVDGSLVWYNGEFLDGVIECRPGFVAQAVGELVWTYTEQPNGRWLIREWARLEDCDNPEAEPSDDSPECKVKPELVWVYPNGHGVLWPVQEKYNILESVCVRINAQMSGAALALIILGFTGDWEQAKAELLGENHIANFPGRNVSVQRVGSTAVIDHLISEYQLHWPVYQRLTYMFDTSVGANTSGVAWDIRLEETKYFVQQTQARLRQICEQWGAPAPAFANYQIRSAQERTQEYALLRNMLAAQVIDDNEFKVAARELLP